MIKLLYYLLIVAVFVCPPFLATFVHAQWSELGKVYAADAQAGDLFGEGVAIDGNTMVIGARWENGGSGDPISHAGAAYVFTYIETAWIQVAKFTASDAQTNDNFGGSVSVSGDTIVVGAYPEATDSAYVFVKPDGGWITATETAKLTDSDGTSSDSFGISVSISGDTIVVGASGVDWGTGSASVFVKPDGGWVTATETAKLTAWYGIWTLMFGKSVSVSGDTIIVGAPGFDSSTGAAYVYVKPDGGWVTATETAKLTASDGAISDSFGNSVSISGDTIVVGAPSVTGSAYVFEKPGGGWVTATETAELTASDAPSVDDYFGCSVSHSGNIIVIGDSKLYTGATSPGAVYVYVKPVIGSWVATTETAKLTARDGVIEDFFGRAVSISGDKIVVGRAYDNSMTGSAYIFVKSIFVKSSSFPWPMFLPAITINSKP